MAETRREEARLYGREARRVLHASIFMQIEIS